MMAKAKKTKTTKPVKKKPVAKPKRTKGKVLPRPQRKSVIAKARPKVRARTRAKLRPKAVAETVAEIITPATEELKRGRITEKLSPKDSMLEVEEPALMAEPLELELNVIELRLPITVKDLAIKLQVKPSVLIKKLIDMNLMVEINQTLEDEVVIDICKNFGFQVKKALGLEEATLSIHQQEDPPHLLRARPPVVTLMGHIDHGKTSLLDKIRKTTVAESEHGGITQHIGAYQVTINTGSTAAEGKRITFLDTPGHEAFTMMRARGARITDIVVLVVAADDGVMPQTIEAIDHAREAKVPIIVAINKIDKPQANIEKVKKQIAQRGLVPEDWQGKTITVLVSAKTGQGINELLEMILLEAEMLELKANYNRLAKGIIIEAKISKGKGPLATLLVQNGTLHINDNFIVGKFYGKAKAMFDDFGRQVREALPSMPVEVLGLSGVPEAGKQFYVLEDEKRTKEIAYLRQEKEKQTRLKPIERISLEHLHSQIQKGKVKELKIILKADVMGSLEAIKESLRKLDITEISLNIIHDGTGDINTSDVILAAASNALILGFNVVSDGSAKALIAKEEVEVRTYNVIYELNNDIKAAVEGMLEPKIKKVFLGRAEVKKVFKLSSAGLVAGCIVIKGKILRNAAADLVRNGKTIFEGKILSLKRIKDDVKEVAEGFECGISLGQIQDLQEGDIIEAYEIQKIARKITDD